MAIIASRARSHTIGILPVEGFALMSYASTVEPLRAANILSGQPLYRTVDIGLDSSPIPSSGAARVTPDAAIPDVGDLDYLFVVAGGDPMSFHAPRMARWLARMARAGVRLGGVSGGPVILANAGLMKDRRMTVHWEHAAALGEHRPELLIERTLFVIDRDRVTCAGGIAALDMMHALIAQHHGAGFARQVSDWFMHTDIRPAIGPQRGGLVARVGTTDRAVLEAVRAMETHVADPLTLPQLAQYAGISPRQLNRLFRAITGRSTMRYYRELRLDKAQNLLRNSPLTLTGIALATGFANSSHFSRSYAAIFGHPPSDSR